MFYRLTTFKFKVFVILILSFALYTIYVLHMMHISFSSCDRAYTLIISSRPLYPPYWPGVYMGFWVVTATMASILWCLYTYLRPNIYTFLLGHVSIWTGPGISWFMWEYCDLVILDDKGRKAWVEVLEVFGWSLCGVWAALILWCCLDLVWWIYLRLSSVKGGD